MNQKNQTDLNKTRKDLEKGIINGVQIEKENPSIENWIEQISFAELKHFIPVNQCKSPII